MKETVIKTFRTLLASRRDPTTSKKHREKSVWDLRTSSFPFKHMAKGYAQGSISTATMSTAFYSSRKTVWEFISFENVQSFFIFWPKHFRTVLSKCHPTYPENEQIFETFQKVFIFPDRELRTFCLCIARLTKTAITMRCIEKRLASTTTCAKHFDYMDEATMEPKLLK